MLKTLRRLIHHWIGDVIPDPFPLAWSSGFAALPLY